MPFAPVTTLDPGRLKNATESLCHVFGVDTLHPHQEEAGQNILRGITTILDVPTGGGKTLAFWYPLFYYWQPGIVEPACQRIVLVVSPLVALMEAQAKSLSEKGVPAVAITGTSPDLEQLLTDLGQNKYRVGLVGPEMALSTQFHQKVLNQEKFTRNIICLVIDELHCIWEWGNDDFRPEYRQIVQLAARLPTGLPILGASATAPYHVLNDILGNLGLPQDCARVQVSNEKLNVSLSVRILQHEPDSFADLLLLFDDETNGPEDFLQSLLYANGRQVVEKIQDFLRDHAPDSIDPKKAFEFYHRDIDEERKKNIQERINSGELRGTSATDALGLGMDFQTIMRVILWMRPRSFLSLVQKIGRCVRNRALRGEAILYITKAMYTRCCVELELMETERQEAASSDEEDDTEELFDREEALALQDASEEEEDAPARYYLEYITTTKCRRIPWDKYFGNKHKKHLNFPVPEGPCCDNCEPDAFKIQRIVLLGEQKLKTGRKGTSSAELEAAVRKKVEEVREEIVATNFPNQHFLTGNVIISDDILDVLAKRARLITSVDALLQQTRWIHAEKYGVQLVNAICLVVAEFPDHVGEARETQAAERTQRILDAAAFKELRARLVIVFNGCYEAVYSEMELDESAEPSTSRKRKKVAKPRRRCQLFLKLPRRDAWADYYELIEAPISMSSIKTLSAKVSHYTSIAEYRADWVLLFSNARRYNIEGSQVYEDAVYLQDVFDRKLLLLSAELNLPGYQLLPVYIPPASTARTPPPVAELSQSAHQ
ncbi:P-loop containing nucleoside triphosphate hydrolase protein [Mycena filopes]|nr:P-loop containing nucleoside triphosphate hydrolase protein [Mycena filopes]